MSHRLQRVPATHSWSAVGIPYQVGHTMLSQQTHITHLMHRIRILLIIVGKLMVQVVSVESVLRLLHYALTNEVFQKWPTESATSQAIGRS